MLLIARLRSLSRKKVLQILNSNGFYIDREGARHTILKKKDDASKVWITYIGRHSEIILPEILSIIRQTGKSREEFE